MQQIQYKLVFVIMFVMLFGTSVLAEDQDSQTKIDNFQGIFNLQDEDFVPEILIGTQNIYYQKETSEACNSFGGFVFSSGLSHLKMSTFSTEKMFVGYGGQGTVVGLLVYTIDNGEKDVVCSSIRTLGASGLYSEKITFAANSTQYLLVSVMENDTVYHRIFEVTTMGEDTKSLLENIEIDFWTEDSDEVELPEIIIPQALDVGF